MISSEAAQKKQSQILLVARKLFLERGYDGVSLDEILEQVGGSKTTLYSYYGGKEGLFSAMIQQFCAEKLGKVLALDVRAMDPRAGLNATGRLFLATVLEPEGHAVFREMVAEAQRFPELARVFFTAGPQSMVNGLRGNIEHWQKRGMLRAGNAEILATQYVGILLSNFHTKCLLGLLDPMTEEQIAAWVEQGTALFLEGTLKKSSEMV